MADNEKTIFSLDLDIAEFTEKALKAKGSITEVGDSKNISGLASGLLEAGKYVGVIGVAFLALKTTMDTVFQAENIKAVNEQFDLLSQNAGLSSEVLKKGLKESSDGLVSETELLKAANQSIVAMGASAEKLPQIMELARKSTAVFGGSLISNFENMSHAIAIGSERQLKAMGIVIDQNKAYRAYANTLGITVNALSEAEKKQAILNAVLEKGKTSFAGVNANVLAGQNSWQRFMVSLKEVVESIVLLFDRVLGPSVRQVLETLAETGHRTALIMKSTFGQGSEAAQASLELIDGRIKSMQERLAQMNERKQKMGFDPAIAETQSLEAALSKLQSKRSELKNQVDEDSEDEKEKSNSTTATIESNLEKRRQDELKFHKELNSLRAQRIQDDFEFATSDEEVDALLAEKKILIEQDYQDKIAEIKNQRALGNIATDEQMNQVIEEMEQDHANKMAQLADEESDRKIAAAQRSADEAEKLNQGIARGAMVESKKAAAAVENFGATGANAFKAFNRRASEAFVAIGDGSKSAGDAMKGFMLNSLADIAQAQGELLMASALVNPVNLAAGAALLVLSGVLRAAAGSAGSGASSVSGGGGGGGSTFGGAYGMDTGTVAQQQQEKKSVTINISGHYFETEQTKTRLTEMIRESSDATDFSVKSIG